MINFYRFNAWLFTVFTIAGIIGFFLTPKAPRIDFDLIGFLYLLENIVPVTIFILTFFCGIFAVYFWTKYQVLKKTGINLR